MTTLFDSSPGAPAAPGKIWGATEVYQALAELYAPPSHAILFEVPDATGTHKTRTADALAMSLWPSRGVTLSGFEIKVSRTDWVKELKDPSKAEAIARYCDYWYLVVSDREIVQPGELPPAWGLFMPGKAGKLKLVKEPTRLEAPVPIGRSFLAAIFRRATEKITLEDPIRVAREEGRKAGYEAGSTTAKQIAESTAKSNGASLEALRKAVDEFEAVSGIRIDSYSGGRSLGEAVKLVRSGGVILARRKMQDIEDHAKQILELAARFKATDDRSETGDAPLDLDRPFRPRDERS